MGERIDLKKFIIKHKALKLILTLVLACAFIVFIGGVSGFGKVKAGNVTIRSAEDFATYSQNYSSENQNDVITIDISEGDEIVNENFVSLGTSEYPFAGEIYIPTSGFVVLRLYNCPLFDYVSTSATITGRGIVEIERIRTDETPGTGGALFANHVYGTGTASWSILLSNYSKGAEGVTNAASFDSVFGEIQAGATVTINFENNTNLAVSGSGNVGLICGTLGDGATLNVKTAGAGNNISVSSSGGHAGGLVGEMGTGAKLKFDSANNTRVNSVTASASGKFAGGIVGYVNDVTGTDNFSFKTGEGAVTDYAVTGTVSGAGGAGGLFGYYKNSIAKFTLEDTYSIASGMTVSSTGGAAGGVFGLLDNFASSFEFDGNASGGETLNVTVSNGVSRGGVCGSYRSNLLTDTFTVTDTTVTVDASGDNSGGLIGLVVTKPAYIVIPGATVTVSGGKLGGGLIGSISDKGTFVDVSGTVTVSGSSRAGLIGTMTEGVLRIQGTTNISGLTNADGQIVNSRGRALIYALGTGANAGWTLKRNTSATDDVKSWGEVLRVDGSNLVEETDSSDPENIIYGLFDVNTTAHTVTVLGAATTMNNITQFALTALNIQLNTGAAAVGALQFTSGSANQSGTLLSGTLTLGADISLAGTGITGLTRDNGNNNAFTGTFDGGGYTITFATGEVYGKDSSGTALAAGSNQGNIYYHEYNGLFAKTSGATVQNLTLSGNFYIRQSVDNLRLGGVSAYATNGLTLSGVNASFTINTTNNEKTSYFGGAVGVGDGSSLNISITGGNLNPTYKDNSGNANGMAYVGGAIGQISYAATQTVSFSSCDLGLTFTKAGSNARLSCFGAAIARVENGAYAKDGRRITLSDVDVDITVTNGQTKNRDFGAILGMKWYASDVTINDVRVDASITATGGGAADFGGLVKGATGHWDAQKIKLNTAAFTLPSTSGSTFGFIANKTFSTDNSANTALYLDVDNTLYDTNKEKYDIAALSISGPTFTTYDEIVADSRFNGADITNNGNSVISITTSGNVINTSGTANTYENKTAYGKSNNSINQYTRYYYNIAHARTNTGTDKYNFLTWTVGQYAHSSLAGWFTASNTFTGALDMTGLSYYPIKLETGVTFTSVTLKLDNNLMETWVIATDDDSDTRSTRTSDNQHYLMHTAVFRNVTADISITGLTIQGNVPKLSDSFCGFLVAGTFGGNDDGDPTAFTANTVTFDGAYITDDGDHFEDTTYAPLFINKIGKRVNVSITGASQSTSTYSSYAGSGYYAGSSLIGDVGDASANTITLTFSQMKFDGRSSATSIGNMDTTYGTTKSIFSRATLLNSFKYAGVGDGSGTYNFTLAEDWTDSTTAVHNVTYGKEIKSSSENLNKQQKYYNSDYYTHPETYQSAGEYDFSTGFLPYVYVAYNLGEHKHELNVNVAYNSDITGYGKYDAPYIIDDGDKLEIIAKIIKGTDVTSAVKINLPGDLTSCDYTSTGYGKGKYSFSTGSYILESTISGSPLAAPTNTQVRKYLAGAYYLIDGDITLGSTFVGLGDTTSSNPEYAFRGVIIGEKDGDVCPTIKIESPNPLILTSLGSVIKDVVIDIDVDYNSSNVITLTAPDKDDTFNYSGGIKAYGAVIGQIFGGDTIIDNVNVTFTDVSFTFSGNESTTFTRLTPLGGYVGVIVNGGLIFRNMTASNVGLTDAECGDKISDTGYLYVNPIIGRVIAGYAFCEKATGVYSAAETVLNNGNKNYSIPVLSLEGEKLSITSGYTVTVPDGQAMYILGAIVNSGAASANGATGNYPALSGFWSAYYNNTTVRGGSHYSTVGTSDGADYTNAHNYDKYSDTTPNKTPYIIRAYTNAYTDGYYYARSLSSKSSSTVINVTGDCDVAAGFRGIGSIYLDDDLVRLRISKMYGTKTNDVCPKITLHMRFLEYDPTITSYKASHNTAGFGLFNVLRMNGANSNNAIYDLTLSGSVFYDVINVTSGEQSTYRYLNNNNNGVADGSVLNVGGIAGYGGKTDNYYNKYYIKDVTMNGLTVEGAKYAGGLIGYSGESTQTSTIERCGTDAENGITVRAGACAGGLIGYLRSYVNINGTSGTKTTILINEIKTKGQTTTDTVISNNGDKQNGSGSNIPVVDDSVKYVYHTMFYSAGGVIGFIQPQDKTESQIKNYIIKGKGNGDSAHISSSLQSEGNTNAGGVIGTLKNRRFKIQNVEVQNVNICATYAGGFIGRCFSDKKYDDNQPKNPHILSFENITLDGNNGNVKGENGKSSITGYKSAGGIICSLDWIQNYGGGTYKVDGGEIKNYNIDSSLNANADYYSAGAIMGYANPKESNLLISIHNFFVEKCSISTNYSGNNTASGTGALFGVAKLSKIDGYNILIKDTSVTSSTTDARTSAIIGNYDKNASSSVKLVGVYVNLTGYTTANTKTRAVGATSGLATIPENYGTNDYIVFADYNNAAPTSTSFTEIDPADDHENVTFKTPYVTINPSITTGGVTITSDGVANSVENLPIKQIITDSTTGKYKYSAAAYYDSTVDSSDPLYHVNNLTVFSRFDGKLVMFNSEVSEYEGTDFPVLILDTTEQDVSHQMINSYLRLLTNTGFEFGDNTDTRFDVVIYNMKYESGAFHAYIDGASLKHSSGASGKFYMKNNAIDSGKIQFSLIDVRFKDPADSSKIAYHLYVPVFVKKVLSYQFDIAIKSGTTYLESTYTPFGGQLIENVGTPVTVFFKYTYSRTAEEWEAAINGGENVSRYYAKTLTVTKANESNVLANFPGDTILVLVDKQTGKPYYAKWSDAYSGTTLNLGAFRSVMTKSAGVISFSGEYFTPKKLEKMMTLTANSSPVGDLFYDSSITVIDGKAYRSATSEEIADGSITKYTISEGVATVYTSGEHYVNCDSEIVAIVGNNAYRLPVDEETGTHNISVSLTGEYLTESYYLSIFTESNEVNDELFHYYTFTTPARFDDENNPAKISDQDAHTMANLIMGKIFDHSDFNISSASEAGTLVMADGDNNELTVTLSARMGLASSLGATLKREMATKLAYTPVYQSFLVYLRRTSGSSTVNAILGNPTLTTYTYNVDYVLNGSADTVATSYGTTSITQNYAEVVTGNLGSNFATENMFEINATLTFEYNAAGSIPAQFPGRSNLFPDNGVTVSGSSNIGFSPSSTAYSKNSIGNDETPEKKYYSEAEPEAATLDLIPIDGAGNFDFTSLGINALNINGTSTATEAHFNLLANLNTTPIRSLIEDYDEAVITIKLSQKQANGTYGEDLNVSTYITGMTVGNTNASLAGDAFTATISEGNLDDDGSTITLPVLHFTVKTGSALETAGLTYGNYMITVYVKLRSSGADISASIASNFVIYTNAKVIPEFIG